MHAICYCARYYSILHWNTHLRIDCASQYNTVLFYSELSHIRAEECINFGAFPRRLNMISDQDCRACCLKTNTASTNVTYSTLKHLKRFYPCPYHGENSTRAKGRCLNFASKNLNLRTLLSIQWYGYKQLETEVDKLSNK